ncbi:unnamed protein product, partial [Pocillopora meandrina]
DLKEGLFRVGGFPCAIGFIDGTHVRITAPHENEPDFVNRKGFHSIKISRQSATIEECLLMLWLDSLVQLMIAIFYLDISHRG